ncbi:hypothetical protein MES5069_220075 [Mesorhizobium escarrei]|uniref:Uncharacterized protein n=1 Tax=Mesorhizobium escarrei TaxID=666018 RepID=A0ABN8JNP6_9HYPH|nr:hypothetical protein MES5069_220075 [Mesorhizobium escarrei]
MGGAAISFLDDFEQMRALLLSKGVGSEAIEDEQLRAGEFVEGVGSVHWDGRAQSSNRTARAHRAPKRSSPAACRPKAPASHDLPVPVWPVMIRFPWPPGI